MLKIDDAKHSNTILNLLLTTYDKTKTTIGFPVISCIKWILFYAKISALKVDLL